MSFYCTYINPHLTSSLSITIQYNVNSLLRFKKKRKTPLGIPLIFSINLLLILKTKKHKTNKKKTNVCNNIIKKNTILIILAKDMK